MAEEKYDVIIVGAGLSGCAAAYRLAKAGLEVVVIERGETAGSKNLSGGILYGRVLHDLIPEYWEEAPVERYINNQVVTFVTQESSFSANFKTQAFSQPPYNAFSVLRSKFDRWMAEKAEEAGAMMVTGIKVDQLLRRDGRIAGICAGDEEMLSEVVIAADGANSFLAQQAGLRGHIANEHLAVGVKSLVGLPRQTIEERFNLTGEEGAAYAVVGEVTHGVAGGGFIYTNKESLSIGVVMRLDDLLKSRMQSSQIAEDFLAHPLVTPLVKDGKLLEYGAHVVPEGGLAMVPQLFTDGLLVVGDAAGFTINSGLVVRGMDLAIGSGMAAAQAVIDAKAAGDFSAQSLSAYRKHLDQSFVMKDLQTYAKAPSFMENDRLYRAYPQFVTALMTRLFTFDMTPKEHLLPAALKSIKETNLSILKLAVDGLNGVRAL